MFVLRGLYEDVEFKSNARPVFVSGVWESDSFRVTDQFGTSFEVVEVASEGRSITALAFRLRFTRDEKALMDLSSIDDPSAARDDRKKAAALRSDLKDNDAATYIDLDDERTRESVQNLEAVGLLDVGRAAEILDAPVQDVERYT